MRKIARLRHVAGGLLGSFVSRNNDLWGCWALGLLYAQADPASGIVILRLLDGGAAPGAIACTAAAHNYAAVLRRALGHAGLACEELARAEIAVHFDVVPETPPRRMAPGEVFLCTVTLALRDGREAMRRAYGHCQPQPPYGFTRRAGYS